MTRSELIDRTAAETQVRADLILSPHRGNQASARARQVAMAAARLRGMSLTSIGKWFGRDHKTVHHAIASVAKSLDRAEIAWRIAND